MKLRNIFVWTLYDFANSIAVIVFFLYFSQWLVVDKGVADFWYNMIFVAGSVLLLVTSPAIGSLADQNGRQQIYLNYATVFVFVFFLGASLIILFFPRYAAGAIIFFGLANYAYQQSLVFYNALLHEIAPPKSLGLVSGIGQAGNWLGQITGLLIALPLAGGALYIAGEPGRAQTFLPVTVIFFILALPMLFLFKIAKKPQPAKAPRLRDEYKKQWRLLKELLKAPGMGFFLLSYFIFSDAINTVSGNFPIYLENVFAVSDKTKSLLLVSILITSTIGAFGSGWISDRIGLKKTLAFVLGSWLVVLPGISVVTDFKIFVVLTILMGLLFGALWTAARAMMTALCPKEKLNFGFSFYTLAERVATLVAPLTWGLITLAFYHLGPMRYRIALFAMAVWVGVGLFFLRKVKLNGSAV